MKNQQVLESEIQKLKAKVSKWYLQMGKAHNYRKFYFLQAKVIRATKKADELKRQIDEIKYQALP